MKPQWEKIGAVLLEPGMIISYDHDVPVYHQKEMIGRIRNDASVDMDTPMLVISVDISPEIISQRIVSKPVHAFVIYERGMGWMQISRTSGVRVHARCMV